MQKRKSKDEWIMTVLNSASQLPPEQEADDLTLSHVLVDVLYREQRRMKPEDVAVLVGVAALLSKRWQRSLPPAKFKTADGQAAYTDADVAERLGVSVEEVHAMIEQMAETVPTETLLHNVNPNDLHRVN